jgi:hypothetical protein
MLAELAGYPARIAGERREDDEDAEDELRQITALIVERVQRAADEAGL